MDFLRSVVELIARRKVLSLLVILLIIAGTIYIRNYRFASQGTESTPLQKGNIIDAVYAIGTVTASKRFIINPLTGNNLREIYVREGDRVKKGNALVLLDPGVIFHAPFDGVINYAPYRAGENTASSLPIMVLTSNSDLYVVANMEQQGALRVKVGQTAKISFDALRKETFNGVVSALYSYSNNFLARIDSVDFPDFILPDMTCDIAIVVDERKDVLLIPLSGYEIGHVWRKRGGSRPQMISVTLGVNDGVMAEVLSGDLEVGDKIMIRSKGTP